MLRARLYYDTYVPLLRHVRASTSTSMYVHVHEQNDNVTYASTRWVPTVRHFLACVDVAGGPQQSGANRFFCPDALPCMRRCSWWVPAVKGNIFFAKYGGPSGGSPLSGGGIIILRVIRRHFLACGRGPSHQPLHVQSTSDACRSLTTLTRPHREHQGGGRRRGLGRERHGAREDSAVVSHAEGSMTVRGFTGPSAVDGE